MMFKPGTFSGLVKNPPKITPPKPPSDERLRRVEQTVEALDEALLDTIPAEETQQ